MFLFFVLNFKILNLAYYSVAFEINTIVNITNIKACRQPANKSKYRCKGTGITNCKNGIDTPGISVDKR